MRGAYSEFVIKKNSLLVDALFDLSERDCTAMCVITLPISVREKINPKYVDTHGKLLNEVNKMDPSQGISMEGSPEILVNQEKKIHE